jgi:hypothetical protein
MFPQRLCGCRISRLQLRDPNADRSRFVHELMKELGTVTKLAACSPKKFEGVSSPPLSYLLDQVGPPISNFPTQFLAPLFS